MSESFKTWFGIEMSPIPGSTTFYTGTKEVAGLEIHLKEEFMDLWLDENLWRCTIEAGDPLDERLRLGGEINPDRATARKLALENYEKSLQEEIKQIQEFAKNFKEFTNV